MKGSDGKEYNCSFAFVDKDLAGKLADALRAQGLLVTYEDVADTSQISDPDEKALADSLVNSGIYKKIGQHCVSALFNIDQGAQLERALKDIVEIDLDASGLSHDPDLF